MALRFCEASAQEGDPILNLAAAYRHGILNHLQVISGWLQLGQPERAAEHLRVLEEGMLGETRLVHGVLPRVASVLLVRRGSAENYGIELNFRVPESLRGFTWPGDLPDDLVGAILDAAVLLLDQAPAGRRLDVVLGEGGGWRSLGLRLYEAEASEDRLLSLVAQLPGAASFPAPPREMFRRLSRGGVAWECYQEGPVGVVRLAWPV